MSNVRLLGYSVWKLNPQSPTTTHMHMLWRFFLAVGVLAGGSAGVQAQQMYKCGSTYSQTPCAPDAVAKPLQPMTVPDTPPGLSGYDLCAAVALKVVDSPEPETARVQSVGQRKAEAIQYAGKSTVAHRYDLTVDAKTQYGVYSGERPYSCWLSEDQRRVLQFSPRRP